MSEYFKYETDLMLACPCCGKEGMNQGFLGQMDHIRDMFGAPLHVSSGYRCLDYNETVNGVYDSAHTKGLALDIEMTNSADRFKFVNLLLACGIERIGIYEDFIHVDVDTSKPEKVMWVY
jgi:uncharacterized protein YcbK (DUF882 family)